MLCLLPLLLASPAVRADDHYREYLVDQVQLPVSTGEATSYAIDLNGDGRVDNKLGAAFAALASQGIDLNGATNAAIGNGSLVHRIDLQSTDAAFFSDPAALASWCVGSALPRPPLFNGTDQAFCDSNYAPGIFLAALSGGSFTSADPATTHTPVTLTMVIAIGAETVALPVQGARLAFTTDSFGPGHLHGQLNGSILHQDVIGKVLPALADAFNSIIQNDPSSATAMQLLSIFDTGCSGNSGNAHDGIIEVCELDENSLLGSLLAPDVQIHDANGNYAPNPANTNPDSNSLGMGFTAVLRDRVFANGFDP
jgi:hypothetical protein